MPIPTDIQAGLASVCITPSEPIWLSGWDGREQPSRGVGQDIYAKALTIREGDGGPLSVLLTADLLGYSREMVDRVCEAAARRHGIDRERMMLIASHNHSAPVTTDVLPLYYDPPEEALRVIAHYSDWLTDRLIEAVDRAVDDLSPAKLAFGQGLAGFAVNRRRERPGGRGLPGVVDHDVPVLAVRDRDNRLRGVVFGYACHTTCVEDGTVNGDYAGHAQHAIEADHPGVTAMFVAGCGADANPIPRFRSELGEMYGRILACAVDDVLTRDMATIARGPTVAYGEASLPYEAAPTRAELAALLPDRVGARKREVESLLARLDTGETLPTACAYPIQAWHFGDALTLIALTGEAVVDYSLRLKGLYGFERTWVAAYANELMPYIPSRRIHEEGGYEGGEGMWEYGHPAPFVPRIEELIVDTADRLVNQTLAAASGSVKA